LGVAPGQAPVAAADLDHVFTTEVDQRVDRAGLVAFGIDGVDHELTTPGAARSSRSARSRTTVARKHVIDCMTHNPARSRGTAWTCEEGRQAWTSGGLCECSAGAMAYAGRSPRIAWWKKYLQTD